MKKILGIGIDIIENNRIKRILAEPIKTKLFLNKVLHFNEISEFSKFDCEKKKITFVASRWAYKEALVKATGNKNLIFSGIFLEKDLNGKPSIKVESQNKIMLDNLGITTIHISLSHEENYSVASVLVEG